MWRDWERDEASVELVESAVQTVERKHPEQGPWVRLAADWLTAGEGVGIISQTLLQDFLWYQLPRKFPDDEWRQIVEATALLLDELELPRYAGIARSPTTEDVLAAWEDDPNEGFKRYRTATEASGVSPPDTDLLRWGSVMGIEEAAVRDHVSGALEAAIVSGELRPGTAGWRTESAAITRRTLLEPMVDPGSEGDPPSRGLDRVVGERIESWATQTYPDQLQEWRRRAAEGFVVGRLPVAPEAPSRDVLEAITASMAWLLDACRDGVKATAVGYLPPALVREAADRFDWWIFDGQPRSEVDVFQLLNLHEMATRVGWLRKRSGLIRTSRSAIPLLEDQEALWRGIARAVGRSDAYSAVLGEVIAHRLLEGPAETRPLDASNELARAATPVIEGQGWRRRGGVPVEAADIEHDIHIPLREWRLFHLLDEERPEWEGGHATGRWVTSLNEAGRATARAHLYARATEPRERVYD
jgi:hypothetical protein